MKASDLIAEFKRIYDQKWKYKANAAKEGEVDCSGAFVVAFKHLGQSIAHGSNTIARQYITGSLRPISEAKPGWAIFKWREANDDMPAKYRNDGIGDLYHIGLLGADGVGVYNAKDTSHGFCVDPLSKWQYAAPLKGVDYEEEKNMATDNPLYTAKVVLSSGYLNVRSAASKTAPSVGKLYNGDTVSVYEDTAQHWSRIGDNRWVSSDYLVPASDTASGGSSASDESGTVSIPCALAKQLYTALGDVLNID